MPYKGDVARDFNGALTMWDTQNYMGQFPGENALRLHRTRRALYASWWFIENCVSGEPGVSEVFFKVREMVREAQNAD